MLRQQLCLRGAHRGILVQQALMARQLRSGLEVESLGTAGIMTATRNSHSSKAHGKSHRQSKPKARKRVGVL